MKFCDKCSNMFYIRLTDKGDGVMYYCRKCGNEDSNVDADDCCISSNINISDTSYQINEFTKFDKTLPRTNKMKCPNIQCCSNDTGNGEIVGTPNQSEVVYIKYNEVDMKYVYICCKCDTHWTTDIKS